MKCASDDVDIWLCRLDMTYEERQEDEVTVWQATYGVGLIATSSFSCVPFFIENRYRVSTMRDQLSQDQLPPNQFYRIHSLEINLARGQLPRNQLYKLMLFLKA